MSFFRIQSQHHLANTPDACKVSLTRLAGRAQGKGQVGIRLAIGSNVMRALGAAPGDKLDLMWGAEADFGKILLFKAERGVAVKKTRESKYDAGYMTFVGLPKEPVIGNSGDRWRFLARPTPAVAVTWDAGDGGVTVTLPAAWWECHTSAAAAQLKAIAAVPMPPVRVPA